MTDYYAVIVSYNPDISRLMSNITKLRLQGFKILVVDNGSITFPEQLLSMDEIIMLGENKGIAFALNKGMEVAKERGGKWVLSMDQDSEPANNMLEEYCKYLELSQAGALCPRVVRRGEEKKEKPNRIAKVTRCPTAGFFLSVDAWERAGKYDEWMFIDYVDYDICTKIVKAGMNIYQINSTYVIQELGKLYVNPFFNKLGKILHYRRMINFSHTYNHSALRNYYFVRNSRYYIFKHKDHISVRAEKIHIFKWEVKKLLLEPKRLDCFKSIINGIRDANAKIRSMEITE